MQSKPLIQLRRSMSDSAIVSYNQDIKLEKFRTSLWLTGRWYESDDSDSESCSSMSSDSSFYRGTGNCVVAPAPVPVPVPEPVRRFIRRFSISGSMENQDEYRNRYHTSVMRLSTEPDSLPINCNCFKCDHLCYNRLSNRECFVGFCGSQCTNNLITNGFEHIVEVFKTLRKGYGLRATSSAGTGTYVMELIGSVILFNAYIDDIIRLTLEYRDWFTLYIDNIILMPKLRLSQFINHSCAPNCSIVCIMVRGLPRFILRAMRRIEAMEEVTINYCMYELDSKRHACFCGAAVCRGVIGLKPLSGIYLRRTAAARRDNADWANPHHVIPDWPSRPVN